MTAKHLWPLCALIVAALTSAAIVSGAARTLDLYFIDVEGGQATLVVTPAGESLLVDTGYAGQGGPSTSTPGDPAAARDASRIAAAARDAGVTQIDVLLMTHFHGDHDGGVTELSKLLPIRTFVDHDRPAAALESNADAMAAFTRYEAVRQTGRHLVVSPGDHLPVKGIETVVVSSAGAVLPRPLAREGDVNRTCASSAIAPQDAVENPRSTGFLLTFGRFRFLELGDLTGQPLFALACPRDLVGPVDVYLVPHHGGADAADRATFAAFRPRVAVVNNGERKGGAPELLAMLRSIEGLQSWQLHRAASGENTDEARIANLNETTSHWIKISAREDGSFSVTNARTGSAGSFPRR